MTKEELAAKLNGREYGGEFAHGEEKRAKQSGLVVVFGASDDLIELRGAIDDEAGCYGSKTIYLHRGGLLTDPSGGDCEHCSERTEKLAEKCAAIRAVWAADGLPVHYSWTYETDIPHATFDIMEGDEKYCRGIVFELAALPEIGGAA